MKTTSIVVLSAVALAIIGLCCSVGGFGSGFGTVIGSSHVIEKTYEVSGFTGVDLSVPGILTIEIGEEETLRVEAEDNLFEYFEIGVRGGVLEIKNRPMVWMQPTKPINLYLTAKTLEAIDVSGIGEVDAPTLEAERFSVSISGSGAVDLESLRADALTVRISGSGRLDIAGGEVGDQDVSVSGSGEYRAEDVAGSEAERVSVAVSGSGGVWLGELDADMLNGEITGAGRLYVAGGAVAQQHVTISGSGTYGARDLESARAELRISGNGSAVVWASDRLSVTISGSGSVRYAGNPTLEQSLSGVSSVAPVGE